MLESVLDVLKDTLHPSSILTWLLLVLVGVLLLYSKGRSNWGRRWLIAVVVVYWMMSSPLGAELVIRALSSGYAPIQNPSEVPRGSAIVVLGGGSFTFHHGGLTLDVPTKGSALRALEAARLYRLLGAPLVIASGGIVSDNGDPDPESEMLGRALVSLGVSPPRIAYESRSRNTFEQATEVKTILRARQLDHFVLVTSPMHMRRSMAVFRAAGLNPIPSVARVGSEGMRDGPLLLPRDTYLHLSDDAIYECLALGYYWIRGRL